MFDKRRIRKNGVLAQAEVLSVEGRSRVWGTLDPRVESDSGSDLTLLFPLSTRSALHTAHSAPPGDVFSPASATGRTDFRLHPSIGHSYPE